MTQLSHAIKCCNCSSHCVLSEPVGAILAEQSSDSVQKGIVNNCLAGQTTAALNAAGGLPITPEGFSGSPGLCLAVVYYTVALKETTKEKENIKIPGKLFG